jgi:MFS family permease
MRSRLTAIALSAGVAEFGDIAFLVGITAFLYVTTDSATVVGFGMAAYGVGSLTGALAGGVLIDALPPAPWLLWGNVLGGALLAGFTLVDSLPLTIVLTGFVSFASRAMLVAQQSCLPLIEPQLLLRSNSLIMTCRRIGQLSGPAVAGGLVATGSSSWVYWINAGTFVVNGIVGFLAVPPSTRVHQRQPGERSHGVVSFFMRTPAARSAFAVNCVAGVIAGTSSVSIVVYTSEVLRGGAREYGLLATFTAVGAVLGTITATAIGNRFDLKPAIVTTVLVGGVALIVLPFVGYFAPAAALRVATGWSLNVLVILLMANLHERAPAAMRGRLIASTRSGQDTLMIVFTMTSGFLVAAIGVRWVLVGVGALSALCAVLLARTADPFEWRPRTDREEVPAT